MISSKGLELVKHFEGLYLKAYKDEVGVWTIGWGHTGLQHKDGTVHAGRVITEEEAELLLRYDMHQFESRVSTFVKVPLNSDQFSALVSFDFNTGGLATSTLLKVLNQNHYDQVRPQLMRWTKAGGITLKGLVLRRASEANLFESKEPFIVEKLEKV
jgi:lysozyme